MADIGIGADALEAEHSSSRGAPPRDRDSRSHAARVLPPFGWALLPRDRGPYPLDGGIPIGRQE